MDLDICYLLLPLSYQTSQLSYQMDKIHSYLIKGIGLVQTPQGKGGDSGIRESGERQGGEHKEGGR